MTQKANFPHENLSKRRGCLLYARGFLMAMGALFLALIASWVSLLDLSRRYECVEMPNGLIIGRATVFSSIAGRDPDIALKYPDGRILVRGNKSLEFWDDTSVAGEYEDTQDGQPDSFVYLNDFGLVLKSKSPKRYLYHYGRKEAVLGRARFPFDDSLFGTFVYLLKDRDRRRNWCPTAWGWPRKVAWLLPYSPSR